MISLVVVPATRCKVGIKSVPAADLGANLDGYVAAEFRVPRLVDFTHSARANLREEFVGTETCTRADAH